MTQRQRRQASPRSHTNCFRPDFSVPLFLMLQPATSAHDACAGTENTVGTGSQRLGTGENYDYYTTALMTAA